jgi:hypothetical protein
MASKEIATKPRQSAAEMRAEERAKRSVTDKLILKYARLSLNEIEEKTGVPAAEAGLRLDELLRARDHLTERMQERALIIEMGDLIDEVRERMLTSSNDNYADIANVALRGYEAIAKRFDALRKVTEADIAEISKAQGEMFLAIMIEAINMVGIEQEELHPDLDFSIRDELEEGFSRALPAARAEIERRVRQ